MTQISIIDRQTRQVLDIVSNDAPFATPFDDLFSGGGLIDSLDTGVATYSFEVLKKYPASEHITQGNIVAFRDPKGQNRELQILMVDSTHDKKTAYCVDSNLVLNNAQARPYVGDKEYPIADYINHFLPIGSGFSVGINEIGHLKRKLEWEGFDTVTKRLRSVATQFDNAFIAFRVTMQGAFVTGRYIDIYKKRGKTIGTTLEYSREVNEIEKKEDLSELATALIGVGGNKEGTEDQEKVTFKNGLYQSDDRRFISPSGDDRVFDLVMGPFWKENKPGMQTYDGYIERVFEYDTQSPQELFNRACNKLSQLSSGTNTYTVDVALIPDDVSIGDTVRIVDHDYKPALYLEADVLTITQRLSAKTNNEVVFGNFIEKQSAIDKKLLAIQSQIKNMALTPGDTFYPWVRYADDATGLGISAFPKNKTYMAIVYKKNDPVPSDDPDDYLGSWQKVTGAEGPAGEKGDDGKILYTWRAYADDVTGAGISLEPGGKSYLGLATNKDTITPSLNPTEYAWSSMYDNQKLNEIADKINSVPIVTVDKVAPSKPKEGDQFWKLDDDGKTIGFYMYGKDSNNNLGWQPSAIQQSVLNIETLNGVTINGSVFNGSKFNSAFDVQDEFSPSRLKGTLSIGDGVVQSIFKADEGSANEQLVNYQFGPNALIYQQTNSAGVINQSWDLSTNGYNYATYNNGAIFDQVTLNSKLLKLLSNQSGLSSVSVDSRGIEFAQPAGNSRYYYHPTDVRVYLTSWNGAGLQVGYKDAKGNWIATTGIAIGGKPNTAAGTIDNTWANINYPLTIAKGADLAVTNIDHVDFIRFGSDNNARVFKNDANSAVVDGRWGVNLAATQSGASSNVFRAGWDGLIAYKGLNMNGNSITNQSDIRLKENIRPAEINPLKEIEELEFVNYEWIADHPRNIGKEAGEQYGLIAQHAGVLRAESDQVSDHYECIDTSKQVMLTTHAVQALAQKNKELEARLAMIEQSLPEK